LYKKLKNGIYRPNARIRHLLKARRGSGRGIHSPYLYRFVSVVLNTHWPYYAFEEVKTAWDELRKSTLFRSAFSGIKFRNKEEITAGQFIFRIVQDLQPKIALEIGTIGGIDTLFITKACPSATCLSTTESAEAAALARGTWEKQPSTKIQLFTKTARSPLDAALNQVEEVDFFLFNAPVGKEQRLNDFKKCLTKKHAGSVFVIKYIHGSPEMEKAWRTMKNHPEVRVSIDLFSIGILLFRQDQTKQHYIIQIHKQLL
jgi:predicted O-methyltransferase YrrM